MILELYVPLMILSLALIVMGFIIKEHTELAIIGFLFLFLLALALNQGGVEYKIGTNVTANVSYSGSQITSIDQNLEYTYTDFDNEDSHRFGLYLAIASFIGFAITIAMVGKTKWRENYG